MEVSSASLLASLQSGELKDSGILKHLSSLLREQIQNKSQLKGMDSLEVFSYFLRKNEFAFQQLMHDQQLKTKMNTLKQKPEYVDKVQQLIRKVISLKIRKPFLRPDILQQYHSLKQCGISIGQSNCVHLKNLMKTIAVENECSQIRFWGKILGKKDYYVVQGVSTKKYFNDLGPNSEPYGKGINSYSYWVANQVLGSWIELPMVTPTQVVQSKKFKYIFSGDLDKPIKSIGQFEGKERHLLKCIIARITHSCQLVPKGLYRLNEQDPSFIQFEDEFKLPELSELNSLESWVHLNSHILQQGRSSYFVDSALNEQEKEALLSQLGQKDPEVQRLKTISEDKPYQFLGYTANWTIQLCGETVPINLVGKQQGKTAFYASVLLRNLVWPGAATVAFNGGWCNIYLGYGQRVSQPDSLIMQVGNLQLEGEEKEQYSQPNPSKPIPPPQQSRPEGEEGDAQEKNQQEAQDAEG